MSIEEQIKDYFVSLPEPKQADIEVLHNEILKVLPNGNLWFLDGKDKKGKKVTNPNIGYGLQTLKYADGSKREFYQIGISASTKGISVYIIGIKDKKYLPEKYGSIIGKGNVTSYCISFKTLKDIKLDTLLTAIKDGYERTA